MSKFWLAVKQYLGKLGLAGVGAVLVGGAIRAIEEILPLTGWHITQNQARVLFWLSVGVLVVGVGLVIAALRKHEQIESKIRVISKSENLVDILIAMHRRLIELQKEKAAHTKVGLEALKKVLPTLADRIGIVTYEDWPEFECELKSKILQAIPPKPRMNIIGRFRYKRWARLNEEWKDRVYTSTLSVVRKEKDKWLNTTEWTFEDGIKIAKWVDGYDWGIQKLRDNDQQWKPLYESLDTYLRDDVLRNLINEHIDLSHIYNNVCLLMHYSGKFKHDVSSLMLYEGLVGSPISPEEVDRGLSEILRDIEKRLKEIANG
jgi:hypothetical protein